jgi:hypothetical protein
MKPTNPMKSDETMNFYWQFLYLGLSVYSNGFKTIFSLQIVIVPYFQTNPASKRTTPPTALHLIRRGRKRGVELAQHATLREEAIGVAPVAHVGTPAAKHWGLRGVPTGLP